VADGILAERLGLPAAVICTEPFRGTGDAMARIQGFDGYRYLVTAHPVSNLSREQLRERAHELLPGVLDLLGAQDPLLEAT
jgi:hypothetical protein